MFKYIGTIIHPLLELVQPVRTKVCSVLVKAIKIKSSPSNIKIKNELGEELKNKPENEIVDPSQEVCCGLMKLHQPIR